MILGILLLILAMVLFVLGWLRLRGQADPDWVRASDTRLVIEAAAGSDTPRATLWRGGGVAFGPCPASWDPPEAMRRLPAPLGGGGSFRVGGAIDLAGEDALATGDATLARVLRDALGTRALLLVPVEGDRPVLLHGTPRDARASAGGIGIAKDRLEALLAMLGDPSGLRVEVKRRRVQRAGWGKAQGQRRRGRG